MRCRMRGMKNRASRKAAAMASALSPNRRPMAPSETRPALARTGTRAIMGTMARSWKMRTPSEMRP